MKDVNYNIDHQNKLIQYNLQDSYPYLYVEISNISSGNGRNLIYSNNPYVNKMTFKCPMCYNQSNNFINLNSNGMIQNMNFKNNDNLFFSVYTPDGMLLKTLENDTTSPFSPLAHLQISATFSLTRL